MIIGITHYCENEKCKVELYSITVDEFTDNERNCPGCGRMGRTKGDLQASVTILGQVGTHEPQVDPHDP